MGTIAMPGMSSAAWTTRRASHVALAGAFGLLLLAAPLVYPLVVYDVGIADVQPRYLPHLALNWACNVAVFVAAWRSKGPIHIRLQKALFALFVVHGLL